MSDLHPIQSLERHCWFKLICGASFQHLPSVHSLALAYAWAGADCIDVAADPAVVAAAKAGVEAARSHRHHLGFDQPLLMVSLNDGEDPHFRKATFDASRCPSDCPRPCESVCPAQAIASLSPKSSDGLVSEGVIESRCYGCGRCLPICPLGLITTRSYVSEPSTVMAMMIEAGIDAVEIHTQMGRVDEFRRIWAAIAPWVEQLQLVAVSCPDSERNTPDAYTSYLQRLYQEMVPRPKTIIWQTDGRPMSGDIGAGTTHAAIQLAQKVVRVDKTTLPGFIQLAGGTNLYTVPKLQSIGLLNQQDGRTPSGSVYSSTERSTEKLAGHRAIAGVAYGSYARSRLGSVLDVLEDRTGNLEDHPDLFQQAVALATELVQQLKHSAPLDDQATALGLTAAKPPVHDRLNNSLSALS